MKVFYDDKQTVLDNPSFSPSAGKPAKVVASWKDKFPVEIMPVEPVTPADLSLVHSPKFVEDILAGKSPNGFGNRLISIANSLLWTNGSFVSAARYAVENKTNTVSPTSGFHHATYNQAMGFCTFNGLMVAAVLLKRDLGVRRIAIADIDCSLRQRNR
jgi:acetoin utilization deacetylase AcuC-like enzyme